MVEEDIAHYIGRIKDNVHTFPVRIYYEDTDSGGIVYHANYLKFAERARTEMIREMGTDQRTLFEDRGIRFVVRNCEIDFKAPARLGDTLKICTHIAEVTNASVFLIQDVWYEGIVLTQIKTRIVCIDHKFSPTKLPNAIRSMFESFLLEEKSGETPS